MNIELYRIVPNATHIMQPLDKGVFGPLKLKWHLTTRKYNRENPGKSIGKENFAQKLTEAFLQFYKPLTVINEFKASGIYPVSSFVVTSEMLKPSLTFTTESTLTEKESSKETNSENQVESQDQSKAKGALEVFEETLLTPVRNRYTDRIREGYDVEGQSPCFDVYRKLYNKAYPSVPSKATNIASGLDLLAEAAAAQDSQQPEASTSTENVGLQNETEQSEMSFNAQMSPVLVESLIYPKAPETSKPVRKVLTDTIPDHLTSTESIRKFPLKQIEKVKLFAEREKKAKVSYLLKKSKSNSKKCTKGRGKGAQSKSKKGKRSLTEREKLEENMNKAEEEAYCQACHMTWKENDEIQEGRLWVQCDACDAWMHSDCLTYEIDENEPFLCPKCFI